MKILVLLLFIFFSNIKQVVSDENKSFLKLKAIELVADKYNKGLLNRLKGKDVYPSYKAYYENECFVSVAAGIDQNYYWLATHWFSVNLCSGDVNLIESNTEN